MPISQLSAQSQEFAVNSLYRELYGMQRPPNDLVGDDDQAISLADRLNELLTLMEQDKGQLDQDRFRIANPNARERDLSNAERSADQRTPFSDFQAEVQSGTVENVAVFHAFLARNNLPFEDDNEISAEELSIAQEFVIEIQSGEDLETIRGEFEIVTAQREVEKEADLARKAEAEAAEAQRLADAEMSAFNERNAALTEQVALEVEGISHKFTIAAFATQQYDGTFELNEGSVTFENGNMNIETQEYLHGMLRQAEAAGHLDKFIGTGEGQYANKWDLRDAMYSDATPYDYDADVPNAQLSERGIEILAQLSDDMGLDVDAVRDKHIQSIVEQRLEQEDTAPDADVAPLAPIPADELPATPTPTELVASQRVLPDYLADFDDQATQSFYTQLVESEVLADREAPRELRGIASEKAKIEDLKDALENGEFADGSALGNPASVKGDIAQLKERFEERIERLSPEDRANVDQYLAAREMGQLPGGEAPRNPGGSIPSDIEHDGSGQEVLEASMGGGFMSWAGQKLSGLFTDNTDASSPQEVLEQEARREAVYDQPMP